VGVERKLGGGLGRAGPGSSWATWAGACAEGGVGGCEAWRSGVVSWWAHWRAARGEVGVRAGMRAELRLAEQSGEEELGWGRCRAGGSVACGQLIGASCWELGAFAELEQSMGAGESLGGGGQTRPGRRGASGAGASRARARPPEAFGSRQGRLSSVAALTAGQAGFSQCTSFSRSEVRL
jgi:hypothetical protein